MGAYRFTLQDQSVVGRDDGRESAALHTRECGHCRLWQRLCRQDGIDLGADWLLTTIGIRFHTGLMILHTDDNIKILHMERRDPLNAAPI